MKSFFKKINITRTITFAISQDSVRLDPRKAPTELVKQLFDPQLPAARLNLKRIC
jgi:hypothetical protein